MCAILCFFFFQAEDGIRDLVRSRGLGDVYKRQEQASHRLVDEDHLVLGVVHDVGDLLGEEPEVEGAVSYTHLTLPTSDLV